MSVSTETLEEIVAMKDLMPPVRLLSPWLRRGSIALLHAQPKTGKTYLALAVALAVARGDSLLGWDPSKPGRARRVMYLDAEMPGWLLRKRLGQLGAKREPVHFLRREALILKGEAMPDLGSDRGQRELSSMIDSVDPELVVLDSLSALTRSGDENERAGWLVIEDWLQEQRAHKRAVLMVHHQGKSGSQRGTSAREEVIDAAMSMTKADNGALRLTIERLRDHDGPVELSIKARLSIADGVAEWRKVSRTAKEVGNNTRARVMALLDQGKTDSQIAKELNIHRKTAYQHITALKRGGWSNESARSMLPA